jgi:Holliday junction DNA helicase RuvA
LSLAGRAHFINRSEVIARLRGEVVEALPNRLVIEAGGVGYQVFVPISSFDRLNPRIGTEVILLTHLHIRENAHTLYGFATAEERDIFLLLVDRVSGIGPAIAMTVLSGMPVERFKQAVVESDVKAISTIKGLGKKTAERIVLELKDKVGVTETWQVAEGGDAAGAAGRDAELALLALGFKQADAHKAIRAVLEKSPTMAAEDLIREALRGLG